MKNSPEITTTVPVLSVSPIPEDHGALDVMLRHLRSATNPDCTFALKPCSTLAAAVAALSKHQFEVVVCERDLQPGSWKDVLEQAAILPDPPPPIVTSRLADDRLWAEALNLGAFDVLAKPFDRTGTMRVLDAAWRAWGGRRGSPHGRPAIHIRARRLAGHREKAHALGGLRRQGGACWLTTRQRRCLYIPSR